MIAIAKSNISLPIPDPSSAAKAFDNLISAWKECSVISEQEKTKRENIRAFRDVNIKAIEENSALLKLYLKHSFEERAFVIQKMFDRLDQSLASGDTQMAASAIAAIVDVTKQSPLVGVRELIVSIHDPNVKSIEI